MATIVNTPTRESSDSGLGLIIGVILAIALIILFFVYGLPALRNSSAPTDSGGTNINVTLPGGGSDSGSSGGASGGTTGGGSPSGL